MTDETELERLRVQVVNLQGDCESMRFRMAKCREAMEAMIKRLTGGRDKSRGCKGCGTKEDKHTPRCPYGMMLSALEGVRS